MNKDISIMIELQRYWDNILKGRSDIEKCEKSILFWKDRIKQKAGEILIMENIIKNIKVSTKNKETELSEIDEKMRKLEKRKEVIKNEKEMTALEHELNKIISDKDAIEEVLINAFDDLGQKETELNSQRAELREAEKQSIYDIKELEEKLKRFQESVRENQDFFDSNVSRLSPAVSTRFLKLIKSQNGKAIASISGEICGACNFQIPFNLIQDSLKESSIVTCTNCGRFLYKI